MKILKKINSLLPRPTIRKRILLLLFSLIIILPCVVVIWGGYFYYNYGIEPLLTNQIKQSINETVDVAEAYLEEHADNMKYDILSMANEIQVDRNFFLLLRNPEWFDTLINTQATQRGLSEVIIFTKHRVIAKNRSARLPAFAWQELERTNNDEVAVIKQPGSDKVRAILKLDKFMEDTYLMIGRAIDPKISEYIQKTKGSASMFNTKLDYLGTIKQRVLIILMLTFVFIIVVTIYFGYKLARIISNPINDLIEATYLIKRGDYSVRIDEKNFSNEIKILFKAFNQMTAKIEAQRNDLVATNELITQKVQFIENVLSKIASGVITLDAKQKLILINDYALNLLSPNKTNLISLSYSKILPEIGPLLKEAKREKKLVTDSFVVASNSGGALNLIVSVLPVYNSGGNLDSYIITFDDMTDQMTAQKLKAWSDVARRIAHEIKNPLTPINLAAQRLESKFGKLITKNNTQFTKYINTIINHVDDIGRIVEDFVRYARLPNPKVGKIDLLHLLRSNIFTDGVFKGEKVECTIDAKDGENYVVNCDKNLISQVFTNILKNAIESIHSKYGAAKSGIDIESKGCITIGFRASDNGVWVEIEDNGLGFPADKLASITEPYVTTKADGTGIGLAIVKKIIEDHDGQLLLKNNKVGACVSIFLKS